MARPDCTARILSGSHVVTPILDPGPALSDVQGLAFLIGRRPVGIQEGSHRPLHDLRALEDVEAADRQREDPGDPADGVPRREASHSTSVRRPYEVIHDRRCPRGRS
jgi:hypothetical protein